MFNYSTLEDHKEQLIKLGSFQVYKPYGLTPKDLMNQVLKITDSKKGAFSGRLDPMACGCISIYLDNACKLADRDRSLNKTYRFQMIFGLETSSLDLLGIPNYYGNKDIEKLLDRITKFLDELKKDYLQKLPLHCSYVLRNSAGAKNPLWWWAKECRVNEVEIPVFRRRLYDYRNIKFSQIRLSDIAKIAIERISLIDPKHDFNQSEIVEKWKTYLNKEEFVSVIECEVDVSSGFYIRQLVADIGEYLKIPTATLEIERISYF